MARTRKREPSPANDAVAPRGEYKDSIAPEEMERRFAAEAPLRARYAEGARLLGLNGEYEALTKAGIYADLFNHPPKKARTLPVLRRLANSIKQSVEWLTQDAEIAAAANAVASRQNGDDLDRLIFVANVAAHLAAALHATHRRPPPGFDLKKAVGAVMDAMSEAPSS